MFFFFPSFSISFLLCPHIEIQLLHFSRTWQVSSICGTYKLNNCWLITHITLKKVRFYAYQMTCLYIFFFCLVYCVDICFFVCKQRIFKLCRFYYKKWALLNTQIRRYVMSCSSKFLKIELNVKMGLKWMSRNHRWFKWFNGHNRKFTKISTN